MSLSESRSDLPPVLLCLIDQVCDQFSKELRTGQLPSVDAILARTSEEGRAMGPQFEKHEAAFLKELREHLEEIEDFAKGIGSYQIKKRLNSGGQAIVYKARDVIDREVILKVSRPGLPREQAQRNHEEAQILGNLDDPGLPQVLFVGKHRDRPYAVYEYFRGRSLEEVLQNERLPINDARELVARLAQTVGRVHGEGVLHRDLKPANVLLVRNEARGPHSTPGWQVILIDFGLGSQQAWDGMIPPMNGICGTPAYMAPEQAEGRTAEITCQTDIFGLGAILYHLLTNRPPYVGGDREAVLALARRCEIQPPREINPRVPPGLEHICLKALAKNPEDRFDSAVALAKALRDPDGDGHAHDRDDPPPGSGGPKKPGSGKTKKRVIKIKIEVEFGSFTADALRSLLHTIKQSLSLEGDPRVIDKEPGSVILTLELLEADAERLDQAFKAGELKHLNIVDCLPWTVPQADHQRVESGQSEDRAAQERLTAGPDDTRGDTTAMLRRAWEGDREARNQLLGRAREKLRGLTAKLLQRFPSVRGFAETDDVLQNALLRLDRALTSAPLESSRHFWNQAALEIRRELMDLTKHYFGSRGARANLRRDEKRATEESPDRGSQPDSLEDWTLFHETVEKLPELEREVFRLLWYSGLSQEETAGALGVSLRTVKRRWVSARVLLSGAMKSQPPEWVFHAEG
jgi:RNA polymerase sigma factor (sigma-70 family)